MSKATRRKQQQLLLDEDKDFLSDHTVSMRRALEYCKTLLEKITECENLRKINPCAVSRARTVGILRKRALQEHAARLSFASPAASTTAHRDRAAQASTTIDVIEDFSRISVRDFHERYLIANRPCLIRNADREYFAPARKNWVVVENNDDKEKKQEYINKEWFRRILGEDTLLPVRRQDYEQRQTASTTTNDNFLDADGRATEWGTEEMNISQWIDLVESSSSPTNQNSSRYYLKDWHFQFWLNEICEHEPPPPPLYAVPPHLEHDVLNHFTMRFTGGDYRFVYWGPAGSQTTLHSDVLNSFSWSFNVCGVKEWTFHLPPYDHNTTISSTTNNEKNPATFVVQQNAGELIFVPATWKHSVVNMEETLSINHNWFTTAPLDLVLDCLRVEIKAVTQELKSWDVDSHEANENMLRGCAGLDVAGFFFMVLTRGLELLVLTQHQGVDDDDQQWTVSFDLIRLRDVLETVMTDDSLYLQHRLTANLASEERGEQAEQIATAFLREVDQQLSSTAIKSPNKCEVGVS